MPTLILHGGSDERVPTGHAFESFRGLKDRGKITELVFYPREGTASPSSTIGKTG
jgi:dipeptidyl aminopeptidase/acylaminoacyl peptidase